MASRSTSAARPAAFRRRLLARLGLDAMPGEDFDLSTVPTVQRAAAEENNSRAKFNRGKQLFEDDPPLISEQDYADLQTALDARHDLVLDIRLVRRARERLQRGPLRQARDPRRRGSG